MGWSKLYKNNTTLTEPQSWSRTSLDDMIGAEIVHNDKKLAIYGQGKYWQSDTFETEVVPFGSPPQRLVARRIEKCVEDFSFARITQDEFGMLFDFNDKLDGFRNDTILFGDIWAPVDIKTNLILKFPIWLILELDLKHNTMLFYTSKEKI